MSWVERYKMELGERTLELFNAEARAKAAKKDVLNIEFPEEIDVPPDSDMKTCDCRISTKDALDRVTLGMLTIFCSERDGSEVGVLRFHCGQEDRELHFFKKKCGQVRATFGKDSAHWVFPGVCAQEVLESFSLNYSWPSEFEPDHATPFSRLADSKDTFERIKTCMQRFWQD